MTRACPRRVEPRSIREAAILSVWTRYAVAGETVETIARRERCSRAFVQWALDEMRRRQARA